MAGLGIFGGTFDPPHLGHLILAAEAFSQLRLDRVLWVLTPDPPHKQDTHVTPVRHRLDMVKASIAGDPDFELSTVELDRPGPHYAVDTVRLLSEQFPGQDLIYLMGGDSLRDLPTWRDPRGFIKLIGALGVMIRPGAAIDLSEIETQLTGIRSKIKYIHFPEVGISASDIRRRVENGLPYRYLGPTGVYDIIRERGLYRLTQ